MRPYEADAKMTHMRYPVGHLLVEPDSEFPYLCSVDVGDGPKRFQRNYVMTFLSSDQMGRYSLSGKFEEQGYLDETLRVSDFDTCVRAFSVPETRQG